MTEQRPLGFDAKYSDWYANVHHGGRQPMTVATLKALLATMPDDAEIKVSHQHDRHPIGIHDPIVALGNVATIVDADDRGIPIYGQVQGLKYVVFE